MKLLSGVVLIIKLVNKNQSIHFKTRYYNKIQFQYEHISSSDDIGAKWEYTSKLQFEIDRHKRVEADLKREISQKNLYIDDLKAEYRHKIKAFQSELNELNAIRDTLESENNHLKYVFFLVNLLKILGY